MSSQIIVPEVDLPEGWMTDVEVACLLDLGRDKDVLEIGAYLGRSTVALAKVARSMVSVDTHRGSPEHQEGRKFHDPRLVNPSSGEFDSLPRFLDNLSAHGVRELVTVIVGSSGDVGGILADDVFDVVLVDGCHNRDAVTADARLAFRVVRPGGVVLFHDWPWASIRLGLLPVHELNPAVVVGDLAVFDA